MPIIHGTQPQAETGFEHVYRYFDDNHNTWAAKLLPGEVYVSAHGEMITTVLGSCISVCIRDVILGIGGMNHFMLPEQQRHNSGTWGNNKQSQLTRYGYFAMEHLLNSLYLMGAQKQNLEIKLFGGAQVLANRSNIGPDNILFIFDYLLRKELLVETVDLGDRITRRVVYFTSSGAVFIKRKFATTPKS